jgi:hypothetical protein
LELKNRIDSIIYENEKNSSTSTKKTWATPESSHCKDCKHIWYYESAYDASPSKYCSITLAGPDTLFVATYYFNKNSLIKAIRVCYNKFSKEKSFEHIVYLQKSKVVYSLNFDSSNITHPFDRETIGLAGKKLRKLIKQSIDKMGKLTSHNYDY